MAKKVGEIFSELLGLLGVDSKLPEYKDIIGLSQEVDDTTAAKFSSNLMTMEAAKMNGTLKSHFKAQTLNGVDAQHDELATEYGLDATEIAELKAIKDTFERNKKLVAKVKENTAKLNKGTGNDAALISKNKELNDLILANKTAYEKQIADLAAKHDGDLTENAIMGHLKGFKYANDKVDVDVNALTSNNLLKAALAEKGAAIKRGADNTLKLVQKENPELDYLENHKSISFVDFATKALQSKNMLAVTDPKKPATGKTGAPAAPQKGQEEQAEVDNSEAVSFYDQQLEAYEKG